MRERPILFSGPLVRAILDGRKTQTRRVVRKPAAAPPREFEEAMKTAADRGWHGAMKRGPCDGIEWAAKPPFGLPGDRLWVREAHAIVPASAYRQSSGVQQTVDPTDPDMAAIYRAGWERSPPSRWRPSIHMPRWASRLTLEITEVRVERLQDITEEDARAEGCEAAMYSERWTAYDPSTESYPSFFAPPSAADGYESIRHHPAKPMETAQDAFARLWNSINGADAWDANPWVWVVSFRRAAREEPQP